MRWMRYRLGNIAFPLMSLSFTLLCGGFLCVFFFSFALLAFVWLPHDVMKLAIESRLQPPTANHWFGTDHMGRDILSMIMLGAHVSIGSSIAGVGAGALIGIPLGLCAAFRRDSVIGEAILRCADLIFSFPSLLTAMLLAVILEPGAMNVVVALGIFNIPIFIRLTRAAALCIWSRTFILAAQLAGKGSVRIAWEHILPNIAPLLIVQGGAQLSLGLLSEAALSYLGFGAQPPLPSWGRMLADAQTFIIQAPCTALAPGFAILLVALGMNLLGEGLRDFFDPRRGRRRQL